MASLTRSQGLLLFIAYLGFISLGLPDTVLGVAWPSVRDSFGLPQSAIALLFFGASGSYFVSSFFTGRVLNKVGIGLLLAGSSALVAASGFGYGLAPFWLLFVACSLLHGLGSGAIDAGLNHYVAVHFSARHMTWLHACYSIGAMLGPLIMTGFIAWIGSWRGGYLTVASILACLSLLFAATRARWNGKPEATPVEKPVEPPMGTGDVLRKPLVWLQMVLFFFYTGLEVAVGQWSFTVLTESRHMVKESAGLSVTLYWAAIAVGRILSGFVVDRLGIDRFLRASTIAAVVGTALFALNLSTMVSIVALALTGLGLAAIYPCLMTRTPQRLGKDTAAHAIGFQVSAAMLGAAILPSFSGWLAQNVGLASIAIAAVGMAGMVWMLHESLLWHDRASTKNRIMPSSA